MKQVLDFQFKQGTDLLSQLTECSKSVETGYWQIQFHCFAERAPVVRWYLGVVGGRLYCSHTSRWTAESLSKTLVRFIPQAQQTDIKSYLSDLHQSGQMATLSPGALLSQILVRGWVQKWQLDSALRMKILVDLDTYLTLGAGQAEFVQDDTLAEDLPLRGCPVSELVGVALERQTNWQQFKQYLPSMNLVPILNADQFAQAALNAVQRQWVAQQVQRKLPLSRIAARLGQDPMEIAKTFAKLARAGVIQLVPPEQVANPTIMVIDDSPLVLRQFQEWVGSFGHAVLLCQHAEQAIAMMTQTKPSLIFIDINLPQISGFELVKQMRMIPEMAKIPVVIMTAEQKLSNKWQAQWSNCEFLTKPVSAEDLAMFPSQLQTLIQNLIFTAGLSP
jgi:CheY-like chemotaxis protein